MKGTPTSRRWLKLYPERCLNGSIRYQLTSAERGVWYDLLCFASLCDQAGKIADRDGRPYPDDFVANRLNISYELYESTLTKCIGEGRLARNGNQCLEVVNWNTYQSEYERQKQYRQTSESNNSDVFKFYEDNFEIIKPHNAEVIKDLESTYGATKLLEAMKIAVKAGNRNLRYVEGILKKPNSKMSPQKLPTKYTKPEDL